MTHELLSRVDVRLLMPAITIIDPSRMSRIQPYSAGSRRASKQNGQGRFMNSQTRGLWDISPSSTDDLKARHTPTTWSRPSSGRSEPFLNPHGGDPRGPLPGQSRGVEWRRPRPRRRFRRRRWCCKLGRASFRAESHLAVGSFPRHARRRSR